MLKRIPSILKNKYLIAFLVFGVWMIFFDRNSMVQRYKLNQDLKRYQQEQDFYLSEIRNDSTALHHLSSDTANLIRFAREKYLMKRDDEDVYVIIPE